VYQHVAHQLSFETIRVMVAEFFGIRIDSAEIYMFKALMAR
jgi:hypothetical protein